MKSFSTAFTECAIAAILASCGYGASFEDCTITCSADTGCPDGFTCIADRCMAAGATAACPVFVTTLAGVPGAGGSIDGTGSAAGFNFPLGVSVDSGGNVYVADEHNHTIRAVTPDGLVTTLAGSPGVSGSADGEGAAAHFNNPTGVAVDNYETGSIYVADYSNHTIRVVTPGGTVTTLAGSPGVAGGTDGAGSAALFHQPVGIAVGSDGNIYVADTFNDTIRLVTPGGGVTTVAGSPGASGTADGLGSAARFSYPYGVAVNNDGIIYVADYGSNTIRMVTTGGVVTTLAGSPGVGGSTDGTGSAAGFNSPAGVAVDSTGYLYIADTASKTVRMVSPSGVVTTLAGSPGVGGNVDGAGSVARFDLPRGVAIDSNGNIYVADSYTIRKITR